MEQKFIAAWRLAREKAAGIGVRLRALDADPVAQAKRILSGHRPSDGFAELAAKGHLEWSLEALAVKKAFTALFSDEEANEALTRLMEAGYSFR